MLIKKLNILIYKKKVGRYRVKKPTVMEIKWGCLLDKSSRDVKVEVFQFKGVQPGNSEDSRAVVDYHTDVVDQLGDEDVDQDLVALRGVRVRHLCNKNK